MPPHALSPARPRPAFCPALTQHALLPPASQEAERRRREFMLGGGAGELDVHHHVFAYLVRPLAPAPLNH